MIDIIHIDDKATNPLVTLMDVRPYSDILIWIPEKYAITQRRFNEPCFESHNDPGRYISVKKIEADGYDAVVYLGPTINVDIDLRIGDGRTEPYVEFLNEGSNKQAKIHLHTLGEFLEEEL